MSDLYTPTTALLKLKSAASPEDAEQCFLLESVEGGEALGRWSMLGVGPSRVVTVGSGAGHTACADPMSVLEEELAEYQGSVVTPAALEQRAAGGPVQAGSLHKTLKSLPPFTGGAVGYVGYDCVRFFEPKTAAAIDAQEDALGIPDATFMVFHSFLAFDHMRHTVLLISLMTLPPAGAEGGDLEAAFLEAQGRLDWLQTALGSPVDPSLLNPASGEMDGTTVPDASNVSQLSNVGEDGYKGFVRELKKHVTAGDIIQAVPSHRVTVPVPAAVTPLQVYRQMRVVNPSPYMFYVEMAGGLSIVGASPEMLAKVDAARRVETHPIAGTRKRGATAAEDLALEKDLLGDIKERAEHVMLVDLGRNDVGRVATPGTVSVDSLMGIERYSHVMHIVSVVTGELAADKSTYDAFRSIFPAGTLSGAPKVRAMELVASLEPQRRGIYGGAVGWWGYDDTMDTAIAIRTAVIKTDAASSNRKVYLQAGGGIVFDSVEHDEWIETVNKLGSAVKAVAGTMRRTAQ